MSSNKPDHLEVTGTVINVTEAKAKLSSLLEEVAAGKTLMLGKAGSPIALLVPYTEKKKKREFGSLKDEIVFDRESAEFTTKELEDLFGIPS